MKTFINVSEKNVASIIAVMQKTAIPITFHACAMRPAHTLVHLVLAKI
jgi:hypothetical protein